MAKSVEELAEEVRKEDAEKRIAAEMDLLQKAKSLTNGNAGCHKTMGEVLYGVSDLLVQNVRLNRLMMQTLESLQSKDGCKQIHEALANDLKERIEGGGGVKRLELNFGAGVALAGAMLGVCLTVLRLAGKI